MAIDFPASPTNGQTFVVGTVTYTWDGVKWTAIHKIAGATETAKGIVELATAAETTTGTDKTRAVHPAGLKVELDKKVKKAGDTMTGNLNVPSLNGGQLAGFRNVLINGAVLINQRSVTISAAAVGKYGPDRWKKVDAGNMTQIVESGNFEPGATYTLSGTGVTTQQLTAPATGDWTLPNIPITATKIQLELGTVATPFERRPVGVELALCQRYYEDLHVSAIGSTALAGASVGSVNSYKATKRVLPTYTVTSIFEGINTATANYAMTLSYCRYVITTVTAGETRATAYLGVDAEL